MTCLSKRSVKRFRVTNLPARNNPPRITVSPLQIYSVPEVAAMLRRVTVKYRPLHAVRPLNSPRNLTINRAATRTGAKRRSVNILLAVIVATSRTVCPTRRTVCDRAPAKRIFRSVEVTYLLMLNLCATHNTFLSSRESCIFGE